MGNSPSTWFSSPSPTIPVILTDEQKIEIVLDKILEHERNVAKKSGTTCSASEDSKTSQNAPQSDASTDRDQKYREAKKLAITDSMENKFYANNIHNHEELTIKLIFSELAPQSFANRAIAATISTFGAVHTSLSFGKLIVDWNDSSLCIPREFRATSAIFAIDVIKIPKEQTTDMIKELSKVICDWNTTQYYNQFHTNCQTFVDAVLKQLKIQLPTFKGDTLGPLFQQMRRSGTIDFSYTVPDFIKKKIKEQKKENEEISKVLLSAKIISFKTHDELDTIVTYMYDLCREYFLSEKGIQEQVLLKAYDRAFWMRYLKAEDRIKEIKELREIREQVISDNSLSEEEKQAELSELPTEEELEKNLEDIKKAQECCSPNSRRCPFNDPRNQTLVGTPTRSVKEL
jgi:hypothetical protein